MNELLLEPEPDVTFLLLSHFAPEVALLSQQYRILKLKSMIEPGASFCVIAHNLLELLTVQSCSFFKLKG